MYGQALFFTQMQPRPYISTDERVIQRQFINIIPVAAMGMSFIHLIT